MSKTKTPPTADDQPCIGCADKAQPCTDCAPADGTAQPPVSTPTPAAGGRYTRNPDGTLTALEE